VADDQRLARQRVCRCRSKEKGGRGDISGRRELAIDRLAQHHIMDHLLLGNAERFCLFRDLFID
jgi:hypothetical protein